MQLPARARDVEMAGERLMAAPREEVWVALNDPEILRRCLPRCDRVERISDVEFRVAAAGVFAGALRLSEVDPPNGYVFEAELLGMDSEQLARVRGRLDLASGGDGTRVRYVVAAQAAGLSAPSGEDARALVEEALACLEKALAEAQPAPVAVAAAHPGAEPLADEARPGLRPGLWVPTLMLIVALILYAAN